MSVQSIGCPPRGSSLDRWTHNEQHPVREAVGHLRAGQEAAQLGVGDVGDQAHMSVSRTVGIVLDQGAQVPVVPGVPEHGGQGIALPVHALQRLGQLALEQQQALIGDARVDDFGPVSTDFLSLTPCSIGSRT